MASLWEILDPSNLRYNTELDVIRGDSGFGPPSQFVGWIRTGFAISTASNPGQSNCNGWTSASETDLGTMVQLTVSWNSDAARVSPWEADERGCQSSQLVCCVQD